jgi:flagellar biosynthetic protein FliR
MISFTSTQIDAWLAALIFPLTRILAMIASSPVFGNKQLPVRVKVGFSVLLAIIIAPTIGTMPPVAIGSAQGLLIMIQQIIIGVAMGLTMRLIFTAVEMAGELTGLQMGLGFASFYDPINATHSPIIAQMMGKAFRYCPLATCCRTRVSML